MDFSFPGKAAGVRVGGGAPAAEIVPAEKTEEAPDDDDIDLFDEETEEEEEEEKAAEKREAAKQASTKKKESGKSSVLMDVKPWDDETDMKKLEEPVRSVEMPTPASCGELWVMGSRSCRSCSPLLTTSCRWTLSLRTIFLPIPPTSTSRVATLRGESALYLCLRLAERSYASEPVLLLSF